MLHRALATLVACGGAGVVLFAACATEETVLYGDPSRVVGGGGPGPTTNAGGNPGCEPDPTCGVSFENDIFPSLSAAPGLCGESGCHEQENGDLSFDKTNASAAHAALIALALDDPTDGGPYIVGCDPDNSKMLCNLDYEDGVDNPYGECGVLMPQLVNDDVDDAPIGQTLQDQLVEWIECGAPNN